MLDETKLLKMSQVELDELFTRSPVGEIPDGEARGTAVVRAAGTACARFIAWFARWFLWQGKVFHKSAGYLVNRITPFGLRGIKARLYFDKSWFDDKDCIVIDYSKTSLVAKLVRDEIREVAPGLYLGQVFLGRKWLANFIVSYQYRPARKLWRRVAAFAALGVLLSVGYLANRFTRDVPVVYSDPVEHFKYGSTGGERDAGIPYWIWKVLPEMFPEHLPGKGLQSLGFVFEPGREFPAGVSMRNVQGIDRVFLNCSVCHVGTVRDTPASTPRVIVGMPANTFDLQGFQRFLSACAVDEKFTPQRVLEEIERIGGTDDWLNRALIRFVAIERMRQRLLTLRQRFEFMDREPAFGPGRVDTFNPPKVLLNFRMDKVPAEEWIGVCDFPSIWQQRSRQGMQLHWDGNNSSVEERNRSAAFGTGALPPTIDRESVKRMEEWLLDAKPPAYPYPIDRERAARGQTVYGEYCASCHGQTGTDFGGERVGKVTPIDEIKTDRGRLDSYSFELCANQNQLYAGYPDERFQHFRKTFGYANSPLDGVWLRAPFLHNGSVPTLRDLLNPSSQRPQTFYRGYDVYDPQNVGFVSTVAEEGGRKYFLFDTSIDGNRNVGHEGKAYGTELSASDKDALIEYLKTF